MASGSILPFRVLVKARIVHGLSGQLQRPFRLEVGDIGDRLQDGPPRCPKPRLP